MGICRYNHKPASHKASRKDQQNYGVLNVTSFDESSNPTLSMPGVLKLETRPTPSISWDAKPWWLPLLGITGWGFLAPPQKENIRSSPAEAAIQLLLAPEQVEASMCIVFVMRCKFKNLTVLHGIGLAKKTNCCSTMQPENHEF